ncbi:MULTISPECIES: hypothetical protein [unclassified Okeania]|uniref:hypothetical protein n=1 Tax=unclassified Okeania TaxID=2634635 RepID=UPI0013B5BD23|nr:MULTISPECIES: hypothetical protein [unclassified Okeania]NES75333.1 hypothetical protein [Okeania sp. SIO1H4]NET12616.1 hypothetical protein [Okeania sp. SIO1H6]NET19128.1 hypothetical protein [Okeania sp. SIO1H5]NET92532.1 hypothetical protein [Okeania sp. SIO1H2]
MLKKYFSRGRRQETGDRRQETGDRRHGNLEEVGAKFCPKIVLPNYAPKILTF